MDSNLVTYGLRDRIAAEMVTKGMSKRSLALESGIPLTTLDRRMRGDGNFTVREVAMLAATLEVPFIQLLPVELRNETRVAA